MVREIKNKEGIFAGNKWLIGALAALAIALAVIVVGVVYLSLPLELPDSVVAHPLTLAEQVPVEATDFVDGLEGTDIRVSFGGNIDTGKLGCQEVTLVFRRGFGSCTVTTQLYRFALASALTVPLGQETQVDVRDFVADTDVDAQLLTTLAEGACGTFDLQLLCAGREYTVQCTVTEDVAPKGVGKEVSVEAGTMPNPAEFVENIVDHTPVTVTYKEEQKFVLAGKQSVVLVLTDLFGNTAEVEAQANVIPAQNGPQFTGMDTIYLELGATVSYKAGVAVMDAQDGSLTFQVDSGNFDNKTPGRYTVYYCATDSDGNTLIMPRTVVVESHIGQIVREKAREVLDKIIKPGMSRDEQIFAVAKRVRDFVWYSGSSDKSSVENGAYEGFTKWSGDCYTYYAMVRVMLDMLEIPNYEARRVGGTSNHWWSVVEFEDGKYYHVDASPHPGSKMNHLKMTESDLVAYTQKRSTGADRRPNYYVYDHTLPVYQDLNIAQ